MNEQVEKLLASTSIETFTTVARGALGEPSATLVGDPTFTEITTPHNDQRTIAIVKVSGLATVEGEQRNWSSVIKFIDPSEKSGKANLDIEQKVYELGLFQGSDVPLRAAKKYFIAQHENDLSSLWLEDLSEAPQPPWDVNQFIRSASHVGQFNGYYLQNEVNFPFDIPSNMFESFLRPDSFRESVLQLVQEKDSVMVRQAYRDTPVETALEWANLYSRIGEYAAALPHGFSFGDYHSRNLFPVGDQTVGIDWGTIAFQPIGADIGRMIGSALTYGVDEANMAAKNERIIFDSYLEGLTSSGWDGDVNEVRIGFFCQFIGYMTGAATLPVMLEPWRPRVEYVKARFGVPLDDLPSHLAPVISLLPKYVDELKQLMD